MATMLGCVNAEAPKTNWNSSEKNQEAVETTKRKSFDQEISKALSHDFDQWEKMEDLDVLESEPWDFKQEISRTLNLDDYAVDSEQERRQQLIQELIPQIREPIILGDLTKPYVAITIDDGYWVKSIEYMLDLFEKYNVKATFFVIWECLKLHPKLWRRAAQHGHEICNHTAHHDKYFKTWDETERFEGEVLEWEDAVKMVLWRDYLVKMKKNFPFFRFPWMHWTRVKAYLDILKKHGYIPIGWWYTENPKDGIINNWEIFLWHFKNQDTINVRKSLELIFQNEKYPRTVADMVFTEDYVKKDGKGLGPIWWYNLAEKKNLVRNNVRSGGNSVKK